MKAKHRFNALLITLLVALLITTTVGAAPKDGAVVSLSVEQSAFDSEQGVLVTVTISNPTNHTIRVLKWFTPAEDVEEPLFAVMRNGEPVPYTGAHYKRPAVTGKDYISLKAGQSITRTVNLAEYYDLSESGEYEVSYAVAAFNLYDEKGNAFKYRDVLTSEKINISVEGRAKPIKPTPTPTTPPSGNTSFNSCTASQQASLITARNNAMSYAANAESYLLANNQGSRYTTWFGVYSPTRYNKVTSNFTAISSAMDDAPVTFDCGCKKRYYAYVYANQPYTIYLCSVFWTAPDTGTDSKAGTLIHEMSHFNVVAGTDDYVYGQSGAMSLAISNPDNAADNADNHEYFAENTPALP
jgi:peptidyl-Lys metalloendopeptidase